GCLLFQRFFQFLEQPHVLKCNHCLVSECFEELDLRWGEGPHLDATGTQRSNYFPLLSKGNNQKGAGGAASDTQPWKIVLRVGNMQRAMLVHPAIPWLFNTDLGAHNGCGTKMSPRNHTVSLTEAQHHIIDPTNPSNAPNNGIEDRLHVRWRTADNAEHLSRCRLMLQGL